MTQTLTALMRAFAFILFTLTVLPAYGCEDPVQNSDGSTCNSCPCNAALCPSDGGVDADGGNTMVDAGDGGGNNPDTGLTCGTYPMNLFEEGESYNDSWLDNEVTDPNAPAGYTCRDVLSNNTKLWSCGTSKNCSGPNCMMYQFRMELRCGSNNGYTCGWCLMASSDAIGYVLQGGNTLYSSYTNSNISDSRFVLDASGTSGTLDRMEGGQMIHRVCW